MFLFTLANLESESRLVIQQKMNIYFLNAQNTYKIDFSQQNINSIARK